MDVADEARGGAFSLSVVVDVWLLGGSSSARVEVERLKSGGGGGSGSGILGMGKVFLSVFKAVSNQTCINDDLRTFSNRSSIVSSTLGQSFLYKL